MLCKFKKCEANALKDGEYCFFHSKNPKVIAKRKAACSEGGANRAITTEFSTDYIELKDINNVIKLLEITINEVRQGKRDIRSANCLGFLSNMLVDVYRIRDVEQKVEALERTLEARREKNAEIG